MGKLPRAVCPKCNRSIGRHDTNRVSVQVNRNKRLGQLALKDFHLGCR